MQPNMPNPTPAAAFRSPILLQVRCEQLYLRSKQGSCGHAVLGIRFRVRLPLVSGLRGTGGSTPLFWPYTPDPGI